MIDCDGAVAGPASGIAGTRIERGYEYRITRTFGGIYRFVARFDDRSCRRNDSYCQVGVIPPVADGHEDADSGTRPGGAVTRNLRLPSGLSSGRRYSVRGDELEIHA